MKASPFFYSQEVALVRIDSWSHGRVVLAGDAAHCASPYSGMGISGGLFGAYVRAGEINRHPDDLSAAPANYETTLRPFVHRIQSEVNPRLLRLGLPISQRAIDAFQAATALAERASCQEHRERRCGRFVWQTSAVSLRRHLSDLRPPVDESVLTDATSWMDEEPFWPAFLLSVGGSEAAAVAFDADPADVEAYAKELHSPDTQPFVPCRLPPVTRRR